MKKLFLKARLRAIYRLLTCPWFICITAKADERIGCCYNVNHPSFRTLVGVIDETISSHEAGAQLVNEVNAILKSKT
jgi:hypothetical protein